MHSAWGWHSLAVFHKCDLLVLGWDTFLQDYGTCTHIYTPHAYTYTHLYTFSYTFMHTHVLGLTCLWTDKYPTKPCLPYLHTHTCTGNMGETGELYPGSGGTGWCCLPPKEDPHPQLLRPYFTSLSDSCWCLCARYVDTYTCIPVSEWAFLSAIHCMWSECAVIKHLSHWAVVSHMSEWAPVSQCLCELLSAVRWVCCRQSIYDGLSCC